MLIKRKLLQIPPQPCPKGIRLKRSAYEREILKAAIQVVDGIVIVDGYDREGRLKKRFFADGKNWQYYEPEYDQWSQTQDGGWFNHQKYAIKGEIPKEASDILDADRWRINQNDLGRMISDYTRHIAEEKRARYITNKYCKIDEIKKECSYIPKDFDDWLMKDVFQPLAVMVPKGKKEKKITCLCCGHAQIVKRLRHKSEWTCPHCGRKTIAYDERYMGSRKDKAQIAIPKKTEGGFAVVGYEVRRCFEDRFQISYAEPFQIWRWKNGEITRLYSSKYSYKGFNYAKYRLDGDFYLYTRSLKRVLPEGKWRGVDLTKTKGILWPVFDLLENNSENTRNTFKAGLYGLMGGAAGYPPADSFCQLTGLDPNYIHEFRENRYGWGLVRMVKRFTEVFEKHGTYNPEQLRIMESFTEYYENGDMVQRLKDLSKWMTDVKALNYFSKQMEMQKRTFSTVSDWYLAYIDMAEFLIREGIGEIDLNSTYFRYPKNIKEAHDRMEKQYLLIKHKEENEGIQKRAERYRSIPQPEGKLIAVFPENEAEFLDEGNALHHCVGWNPLYRQGQAKGTMITFFIRKKEQPEKHFFTATYNVSKQTATFKESYGENHKTPGKEVKAFIDAFMQNVNQALA